MTGDLKSNTKSAGEKDIRMGRIATSEINMKVPVLLDLQNSVARDNVQRLSIKKALISCTNNYFGGSIKLVVIGSM